MAWTDNVDIYCERMGASFWAEPANALSNLAFIVAALLAARTANRLNVHSKDTKALIALAGMIGIGSFLFHTFANRWSELADVIPIWTFVALFVLAAIHRVGGVPVSKVALHYALPFVFAFVGVMFFASGEGDAAKMSEPDQLNGSGQYFPAVIALLVFSTVAWRRKNPMGPWIWAATATFIGSLAFRTVDMRVCQAFPIGSHFMWHLLNAVMIGLLLDGFIKIQTKAYNR